MELTAVNIATGQVFEGGLDQIVAWMETVSEDIPTINAIANVMADMEITPIGSELMEEQLDKINRLGERIGVEFAHPED